MLDHTDNIILIQKKVKHCVHIIYAHHFAYLDDILAQIFFVLVLRDIADDNAFRGAEFDMVIPHGIVIQNVRLDSGTFHGISHALKQLVSSSGVRPRRNTGRKHRTARAVWVLVKANLVSLGLKLLYKSERLVSKRLVLPATHLEM